MWCCATHLIRPVKLISSSRTGIAFDTAPLPTRIDKTIFGFTRLAACRGVKSWISLGVKDSAQSIMTTSSGLAVSTSNVSRQGRSRLWKCPDIIDARSYTIRWSSSKRALPLFPTERVSLIRRMLGTLTSERSQSDALQKARRVRFQNRVDTSNNGLTQDRFVAGISPSQAGDDL